MFWVRYAGVVLFAHGALFLDLPLVWQAGAALLLTGVVPGLLLVELLVGGKSASAVDSGPVHGSSTHAVPNALTVFPPDAPPLYERLLYAVGAGLGCMVTGMLLLNFLPGPLTALRVLTFFDGLLLLLACAIWLRPRPRPAVSRTKQDSPPTQSTKPTQSTQSTQSGAHASLSAHRLLWIGLLALALVGGTLRFLHLDYAEFQGDEARPLLRAVETLHGNAQAIYEHQKGPAEILIPALIYALGDGISEAAARLPFTVAGFTGLFAVFLLGWRMFHPVAGWVAALLLALDGYLIGFARIVQYQSLVFLMVVLCLLIFYRLVQNPRRGSRYLVLAAFLLATGLLAHYEAALVVLPGVYLLLASGFWRHAHGARQTGKAGAFAPLRLLRALLAPVAVGAALLAIFYVPFVLAPEFGTTYAYIAESRIGGAFPYNNLVDFFRRTTLYSTSYYIGLLAFCALVGLALVYRRMLPGVWGWGATGLVIVGLAVAIWAHSLAPELLTARLTEIHDPTWLLFAVAFGLAWFAPGLTIGERAAWIWLGALMILMLFFVRTPNTHVYGFIIPWAVVAGMVAARGWVALSARLGTGRAYVPALAVVVLFMAIFGNFAYGYFADATRERLFTWRENRLPGYWVPYAEPDRARFSSFGFPMRNGWKAIGALYGAGREGCARITDSATSNAGDDCLRLHAPFDTNDRQAVADWYTRGAYCPRDHRYFLLTHPVEPGERENVAQLRADLLAQDYTHIGVVQVGGHAKMEIYDREAASAQDIFYTVPLEEYSAPFDQAFSHPRFQLNGPTVAPVPQHRLDYRVGEHIRLLGYDLARMDSVEWGEPAGAQDALVLTLYWRTAAPLDRAYTVFNQVLRMDDFHNIGQRDGEPGCNQFPTDGWTPHTTYADRYYIPLDAQADPGVYALLSGMYARETGDRLPIFAANGDFIGDSLVLSEIEVGR